MKLLNIRKESHCSLGVWTEHGVLDVELAAKHFHRQTVSQIDEVIKGTESELESLRQLVNQANAEPNAAYFLTDDRIKYGPCVTNPGKILCVGLNYRLHAEEAGMAIPTAPILFSKFNNALAAHGDTITIPKNAEQVDYEVELVIVIGKQARNLAVEEALSYVFGYCTGNDLSARDLQFKSGQWLLGKTCDGFAPVGPYVVTADEIPNPNRLGLACKVNGEVRQSSNTEDMIFNCAEIISYASHHMTLEPGDIIFTGTPQGVISGYPESEQQWLQPGDEISVTVEKLGELKVVMA